MGYSVQKADFGLALPPRFFVYSDTCELSLAALYATADEAESARQAIRAEEYEESTSKGQQLASTDAPEDPETAQVFVIKLRRAYWRGKLDDEEWYSLATPQRLLLPGEHTYYYNDYALMRRDGVLHASKMVCGGFAGDFLLPACDLETTFRDGDEGVGFGQLYGQPVDLCRECLRALLHDRRW